MSRVPLAVLLALLSIPAFVRADPDAAARVQGSLATLEPLMSQPSLDQAAFDRAYASLEQAWAALDSAERAPYEVRRQKVLAFSDRLRPSTGAREQARAALAARLGLATEDLAGVRDGADLAAALRGLYDGERLSKGALDAALSTMESRDVRSLLTAFQSQPQLRGSAFGAPEPPSPEVSDPASVYSYGFDPYFPLKYGPGFDHIDHVEPGAPKGGTLRFATTGKIETYNPFDFVNQGTVPGVNQLVFETLMGGSRDNATSQYGLIAESVQYAKDFSWVQFKIRPEARFSNGAPITAQDIEFSYRTERASDPYFDKIAMKPVAGATVVDERTIRFALKADNPRQAKAAITTLGSIYALSEDFYTKHPLDSLSNLQEPPLGSGPYVVEKGEAGKYVVYKRDPDYWGKDLPLQKGQYNFDRIRYDRYMDPSTARTAFERGDASVWFEGDNGQWNVLKEKAPKLGFKTEEIPRTMPPGFLGLAFNTSKPIFQDARVRRALSLAMNYTWINKYILQGQMTPSTSFFQGTAFAHGATVSEAERKLLADYHDLPAAVFDSDPNPAQPAEGDAYNRGNLKQAMALLKQAGWSVDPKSLELVDGSGRPFSFEIIYVQAATEKYLLAYAGGLRRLGIHAELRRFDSSAWQHAVDQDQYDMVPVEVAATDAPNADWLRYYFSSQSAGNRKDSGNYAKIKNPAVDALIERIGRAETQEQWKAAAQALDRVLLGESYFIPLGEQNDQRVAYRSDVAHEKDPSPYEGTNPAATWWSAGASR